MKVSNYNIRQTLAKKGKISRNKAAFKSDVQVNEWYTKIARYRYYLMTTLTALFVKVDKVMNGEINEHIVEDINEDKNEGGDW